MKIRDRVKELRRVRAADLQPNPRNWRTHPKEQQAALRGVLAEIGFAGALLARELDDGSLELIDGHLRAETTPNMLLPVLVLDVTKEEADRILATHDPLSAMALADEQMLSELLADVQFENESIQAMLDQLLAAGEEPLAELPDDEAPREAKIGEIFQVVAECRDESGQKELFERLSAEGYKCRLLML